MLNVLINNPVIENYFSNSPQKVVEFIEKIVNEKIKKESDFSKEAKDFLALGGSNCWSENLEQIREDRLKYDIS
ncbi:MAG: hypothetical protein HXX81_00430 [Campylobacterales bacterium]|nr:hypothetical protein [Campylobacterales bacterium]